jgi:hypothetical protein
VSLNVLAQIHAHLGGFKRLDAYRAVASTEGCFRQSAVIDGASKLFADVLGDKAGHARTIASPSQLTANAAVIPVELPRLGRNRGCGYVCWNRSRQ